MSEQAVLTANQKAKLQTLRSLLSALPGAVVAYSGGVDSTLLLAVAADVLPERVLAVTASSATYPADETAAAVDTATALGVPVQVIETNELLDPRFTSNPRDRCYHCKTELFGRLSDLAREREYVVLDGANLDDLDDERPGMTAAKELGVRSLLIEAELTKDEIRALSRHFDLRTASKPSLACLASRVPYGTELTPDVLDRIGRAERAVRDLGFEQVRVRFHGPVARIEVGPDELGAALEARERIARRVREAGFTYVALDLEGYRSGAMNETPQPAPRERGAE